MLHLGVQCSLESCKTVDFLPILCQCNKYFCRDHIQLDAHPCTTACSDNDSNHKVPDAQKLARCDFKNCQKPSLEAFMTSVSNPQDSGRIRAVCEHCSLAFCAEHRHPKSHSCSPPLVQEEPKNKAALKLLEKHFPSANAAPLSSRRKIPKIPTDPAKLTKYHKVEMMKLRHHAKPGDPSKSNGDVPVGDRLHVKVGVDTSTDEKALWFTKNIITGKALDCLVKQFSLPRPTAANPLQLYLRALAEPDTLTELPNDKPLSLLVADGSSLFITTTHN